MYLCSLLYVVVLGLGNLEIVLIKMGYVRPKNQQNGSKVCILKFIWIAL